MSTEAATIDGNPSDGCPVTHYDAEPAADVRRYDLQVGWTSFDVTRTARRIVKVKHGYAVVVSLVYAGDDAPNPDEPVAADLLVLAVTPDTLTTVGPTELPCLKVAHNFYWPVENLHPDGPGLDHDQASWHPTAADARERAAYVARHLTACGLDCTTSDETEGS